MAPTEVAPKLQLNPTSCVELSYETIGFKQKFRKGATQTVESNGSNKTKPSTRHAMSVVPLPIITTSTNTPPHNMISRLKLHNSTAHDKNSTGDPLNSGNEEILTRRRGGREGRRRRDHGSHGPLRARGRRRRGRGSGAARRPPAARPGARTARPRRRRSTRSTSSR
jgi:hypothetical protein